jgi:hypothetical protein
MNVQMSQNCECKGKGGEIFWKYFSVGVQPGNDARAQVIAE